jgi:hypothetical protein
MADSWIEGLRGPCPLAVEPAKPPFDYVREDKSLTVTDSEGVKMKYI